MAPAQISVRDRKASVSCCVACDAREWKLCGSPACVCRMQGALWRCAGQKDEKVQEHLEKIAEQDLEKHTGGGDEDDEMLAKLRAELHAEKNHVETAPAVEGTMK